jgi:general secretion pathway protein I
LNRFPARQGGFTLLEVLVAFAILALSLGVLIQIFSTGLNNVALGSEYSRAILLAQSQLAALGVEAPLAAGESNGEFGDGYRWHVTVTPYDLPPPAGAGSAAIEAPDSSASKLFLSRFRGLAPGVAGATPVQAYDVAVEVMWGEGGNQRSVTLRSLKLAPPAPG